MTNTHFISHLFLIVLIGFVSCLRFTYSTGTRHKVHCSEDVMRVEIVLPQINDQEIEQSPNENVNSNVSQYVINQNEPEAKVQIYLDGLKGYPNEKCHPTINGSLAIFRLSLSDFYECGVTRMINQLTGKKVYYHKIIVETNNGKEVVGVKCITSDFAYNVMMMNVSQQQQQQQHQQQKQHITMHLNHHQQQQKQIVLHQEEHGIVRRDVLPAGFQEPEDLEITTSLTERAPEPRLSIGVSQNGKQVNGDLTVTPGTPLTMEIKLDRDSAPVYGLGVNYLEVTDTRLLSETIIFKGCTVDPYLFENFNTIDGDVLSAKFKAFKFPDSSYVQFRATVNVCLDKCLGNQCSNGQIGYGRRRREIRNDDNNNDDNTQMPLIDTNKVYEISLAMFIKVQHVDGANSNEVLRLEEKLRELKMVNQRLARNSRGNMAEPLLKTYTVQQLPLSVTSSSLNADINTNSGTVTDTTNNNNGRSIINAATSKSYPLNKSLLNLLIMYSYCFTCITLFYKLV